MPRKLIRDVRLTYTHFSDKDIKEYLNSELDNQSFKNHCQETANNLKLPYEIVEDVLKDQAFQVLKLLQQEALKKKRSKFNIYGFLSFESIRKSLNTKFIKHEHSNDSSTRR